MKTSAPGDYLLEIIPGDNARRSVKVRTLPGGSVKVRSTG